MLGWDPGPAALRLGYAILVFLSHGSPTLTVAWLARPASDYKNHFRILESFLRLKGWKTNGTSEMAAFVSAMPADDHTLLFSNKLSP